MTSNFDYYNFQRNSVIEIITNEIEFYENSEYHNLYPINDYLTYLKNRIGIDKPIIMPLVRYDGIGNRCEIKKMDLDEYVKDMDVYVFKKQWQKLREFHKIMKIKEWVDSLPFNEKNTLGTVQENKDYLKTELCNGLKTKKFCKGKCKIIYDTEKMKIVSISSVVYNKKRGLYAIKWDIYD